MAKNSVCIFLNVLNGVLAVNNLISNWDHQVFDIVLDAVIFQTVVQCMYKLDQPLGDVY